MTDAIEIDGLAKRYGDKAAVEGLELRVPRGEFHALLGPNGAGKTTTLRIIAGILRPDAGTVRIMGHDIVTDPAQAKRAMAFIPDEPPLYGRLRPLEYLEFVAGRARPGTLRAAAFDLKTFFSVVGKDPTEVSSGDVFEFLAHQRGDRTVVRIVDRESGLAASTIATMPMPQLNVRNISDSAMPLTTTGLNPRSHICAIYAFRCS